MREDTRNGRCAIASAVHDCGARERGPRRVGREVVFVHRAGCEDKAPAGQAGLNARPASRSKDSAAVLRFVVCELSGDVCGNRKLLRRSRRSSERTNYAIGGAANERHRSERLLSD